MPAADAIPTVTLLKTSAINPGPIVDTDPEDIVDAAFTYFGTGSYPITTHDFLSFDMYVTPTETEYEATWTEMLTEGFRGGSGSGLTATDVPAFLRVQGQFTANPYFTSILDDSDNLYDYANIITVDYFTEDFMADVLFINTDKVAAASGS